MGRNLILCADGTGNRGGYSPDSNVYRIYKAVDQNIQHAGENQQLLFYDNGVGTQRNKIWRALSAGVGFGFKSNVKDLYRFLSRHYRKGDRIYLFGFSRGAATIRACSGFIAASGLVKSTDNNGNALSYRALEKRIDAAMKVYEQGNHTTLAKENEHSHGAVDIEAIGVWDTVSALGFPQRTDISSIGLYLLNWIFTGCDKLTEFGPFKHRFYHYELTDNVKHAYQALSIDDARTAFWPLLWDENKRGNQAIEQVWFAGMHSNVGGGYGRSGLASVALHWMLTRPAMKPLRLLDGTLTAVKNDSHAHGRMYNSRDGLGVLYRYHPRNITALCQDKVANHTAIKIHHSVLERLQQRTGNYTPCYIPDRFTMTDDQSTLREIVPAKAEVPDTPSWDSLKQTMEHCITVRKWLYGIMLESIIALAVVTLIVSQHPVTSNHHGFTGLLADGLHALLPNIFSGVIEIAVIEQPGWLLGATLYTALYLMIRAHYRKRTIATGEKLRRYINKATE